MFFDKEELDEVTGRIFTRKKEEGSYQGLSEDVNFSTFNVLFGEVYAR